MGHPPKRDARW